MSYNYDECVQSIREHRRRAYGNAPGGARPPASPDLEALQQSMDGFATLSKHCPMTPLLWMQYAQDTEVLMEGLMTLESSEGEGGSEQQQEAVVALQAKKSALESSTGVLELALAEFPGCSLLHLYYLESLTDYVHQSEGIRQLNSQSEVVGMEVDDRRATFHKLSSAFENAWGCVGSGSHVNEGAVVSEIYRLHGNFLLYLLSKDASDPDAIMQQLSKLFDQWSKTPMGDGSNDEMIQDMEYIWDEACSLLLSSCAEEEKRGKKQYLEQQKALLWGAIDDNRKETSSLTRTLSSYENDIDVAMANEGINAPWVSFFSTQQDDGVNGGGLLGSYAQTLKRSREKWIHILSSDSNRFLLGLGGSDTSRAFLKGASILQRTYQDIAKSNAADTGERSPLERHVSRHNDSAISSLYERALSECPTVESLWISYISFLKGEWTRLRAKMKGQQHMVGGEELYHQQLKKEDLSAALQSTSQRAVRNCPYSSTLFETRMTTLGLISVENLEPDDITAVVQEATELGFLNHNREAMLHLRLTAILVVKRRLLSLVSLGTATAASGLGKDYDEGEEMDGLASAGRKKSGNGAVVYQSLNPTVAEEVQDLVEDIRDMYDETDTYLFKSHPKWAEGKCVYWKHRALTEAYALCPIGVELKEANGDEMDDTGESSADKDSLSCFEKLVKAQKPSHPDSWREYIKYVSAARMYVIGSAEKPGTAVSAIRKTRGLYERAISSVKKAGQSTPVAAENMLSWMGKGIGGAMIERDYDAALSDLCREYLDFERAAGSEESYSHAQSLVRSKMASWTPPLTSALALPTASVQEVPHGKRKLLDGDEVVAQPKEVSMDTHDQEDEEEHGDQMRSKRVKVKTNLKQPKKTDGVHKVRIGKMEYPAHPFTIHVSNLSKDTQDMDLVDAFREEFGAVVHAKVLREKRTGKGGHHYHGESKCAGLIQFEERLSVESALQKDGEFEVGGAKIKIQRSHLPAVGVVPSGMHRVNPKGEGKASKRNQLKKESKLKVDTDNVMDLDGEAKGAVHHEKGSSHQSNAKKGNISAESPSSLSLSVLSFKPRSAVRQKPKIDLGSKKR